MIERRPFGQTGHQSSGTLFGAASLARASQDDADRALEVLLRYGVNHIDSAARYGDSELRIGAWMGRHRKDFFLATKTGERSRTAARDSIHRSLERLGVNHVDLIQLHSLAHPDEWEQAMGPGGALEAAVEAREQKLVRFIGVTGHGWTIAAMPRALRLRSEGNMNGPPAAVGPTSGSRHRNIICQTQTLAAQEPLPQLRLHPEVLVGR